MWFTTGCLLTILSLTTGQNLEQVIDGIRQLYSANGVPFQVNYFEDNPQLLPVYDFIIVGSGPAGCAIANRLTEWKHWNVLLIEKGPEANTFNDIPFLNTYTLKSNFAESFPVEYDPRYCSGIEDKVCQWPTGKGVGGASLINGMISTRGQSSDYDRWALEGNEGWSYNDLLHYFLKIENMTIPLSPEDMVYHNTEGPINIEYPFRSTLAERFLKAGQELGYDIVDYNNPNKMLGFSATQGTIKSGKRHSAASAYLHPIRSRKNLHVLKEALVTKILIDPHYKYAYGVKYQKSGEEKFIFSSGEVIVSAGAFGSPKLLMLSGIGPRDHLRELEIPIIIDSPVGYNLQEHTGLPVSFLITSNESFPLPKVLEGAPATFKQWISGNGGGFSNNGPEALGYLKSSLSEGLADIELIFLPVQIAFDGGIFAQDYIRISEEVYNRTWSQDDFKDGFLIAPMGMYPLSRGTVRLRSTNPNDPPIINANFLDNPRDIKVLIDAVRIVQAIGNTKIFQDIGATLNPTPLWGCESSPFDSDNYWECVARRILIQYHHQSGTCMMGPHGVVDSRLKVHGIRRLRVADASIMPHLPGIHTMVPSYMIGEKTADLIKADWLYNKQI